VAGALAERDFVLKLEKAGFTDVEIRDRTPWGIDDLALSPLFTDELIELMRRLLPPDKQRSVATAVVIKARVRESGRSERPPPHAIASPRDAIGKARRPSSTPTSRGGR